MALTDEQRQKIKDKYKIGNSNQDNASIVEQRINEIKNRSKTTIDESGKKIFNAETFEINKPVVREKPKGFISRVLEKGKERLSNIGEQQAQLTEEQQDAGVLESLAIDKERKLTTGGQVAGFAGDVFGEALTSGGRFLSKITPDVIEDPIKQKFVDLLQTPIGQKALSAISAGSEAAKKFEEEYPREAADIEAVLNIGAFAPIGKATQVGVKPIKSLLTKGEKAVASISEKFVAPSSKKLTAIQEVIAPALNKKEVIQAIEADRITRGGTSRLFGQKPDIVDYADDVINASNTIDSRIPGASKMNDLQLKNEIDNEISSISNELSPKLKEIQFDKELSKEIDKVWEKTKKTQAKDPEFVNNTGSKRFQSNFETFLNEIKKPVKDPQTGLFRQKNLDDMWNLRKDYDNSIPDRVKNATPNSSPFTQLQKEMWLENRAILNDIINETAVKLDVDSAGLFSDMSNLYTGRNNIIQKAKVDFKGSPGILSKETLIKNLKRLGVGWIGFEVLSN